MQFYKLSLTLCSSLLILAACNDSTTYSFNSSPTIPATPAAAFSPADGGPTTNNLLFGTDGTLNFPNPIDPTTGQANPVRTALNTLDGFSTTNPITTSFGTPLDQASLSMGDTIHLYEVDLAAGGGVASVIRELDASEIAVKATGEDGSTLALIPLKPLKESTSYMAVLTNAIHDEEDKAVTASGSYVLLKSTGNLADLPASTFPATDTLTAAQALAQAQGLQALVGAMEAAVGAAPYSVAKASIILSWSFTTQSITPVLDDVATNASAGTINMVAIGKTTKDINPALPGVADISIGTLDIPYYLAAPAKADATDTAALTSFWKSTDGNFLTRTNTTPGATETLTIPVIMSTPNASSGKTKPASGWPVVMYQHGITRVRTDLLAIADTMAAAGFAVIAIDLPMHGVTPDDQLAAFKAGGSLYTNPVLGLSPNTRELTFDMDFVTVDSDNSQIPGGSDGKVDPSGTHFINLASLLTARDNIRQGAANLLVLRRSLGTVTDLDSSKVGFIAHSLGGIIGTTYLGVESAANFKTPTSLITTGGGIAHLLDASMHYAANDTNPNI